MDTAVKYGRKVAFVGRSMVRNMGIAQDLGYLNVPDGVMVDIKQVGNLPPSKVVLMSTGSQGEPMAALSRMANNDHHIVTLREGDTVVLASSLIPATRTRSTASSTDSYVRVRTSSTRATPWCTCRATPAPASSCTATTS
jgi:mRNA degradation ribonuclease J1/J2